MDTPENKDWNAFENRQPPYDSNKVPFYVIGEVVTTNGAIVPKLNETVSPGLNERILLLNLTLEKEGDFGTEDVTFRQARFDKDVPEGQYEEVHILWEGDIIQKIKVQCVV